MHVMKSFGELEAHIAKQVEQGIFPEKTVCSLPVYTKKNNRIFKAVFLYQEPSNESTTLPRPFAWVLLPTGDNIGVSYNDCYAIDFMPQNEFPLNSTISAYLPTEDVSEFARGMYRQEVVTLLGQIGEFAFKTGLSEAQQKLVDRFSELFMLITYQGLYPFYDSLAPDFFNWANLTLIAKSNKNIVEQERNDEFIELLETVREKLNITPGNNEILLELNNKINELKIAFYNNSLYSLEKDVIVIIDHINKSINGLDISAETIENLDKLSSLIGDIEQDLIDLLYRQGIDSFKSEGVEIDVSRQKVIDTMPTGDPELDKTLAERLGSGWIKKDFVIRPELVKAFLYDNQENEEIGELADDK